VLLCGLPLPFTHSILYLGIEVCAAKAFKVSLQNKHLKFFRAFNAILARTGGRSSDIVVLHLTRSFCLPVLLYGLESVSDNSVLRSVHFCWPRILLRVFKVSSVDNSVLVCYYAGIFPPAFAVDLRKLRYYSQLCRLHLDSPNANITWHCMHASNSHFVQLLFVSYSVYFDIADQTLVWAVWNQFHMSSVYSLSSSSSS